MLSASNCLTRFYRRPRAHRRGKPSISALAPARHLFPFGLEALHPAPAPFDRGSYGARHPLVGLWSCGHAAVHPAAGLALHRPRAAAPALGTDAPGLGVDLNILLQSRTAPAALCSLLRHSNEPRLRSKVANSRRLDSLSAKNHVLEHRPAAVSRPSSCRRNLLIEWRAELADATSGRKSPGIERVYRRMSRFC